MGAELLCISTSMVKRCPQLASTAIAAACSVCSSIPQATNSLSHIFGGKGFPPPARQLLSLSCSVRGPCVQGEGFEQKPKEPEELRIPERSQKAFLETPSGGWRFGETQCCLSLQDQQLQGEGSQAGELAVCKRCASVQIMRVWWGKGE